MKKIVAIGGGEVRLAETLAIDKEIIKLSGKKKPKLLFIPTASSDAEGYCQTIEKYFGKKLGCNVDHLLLLDIPLTKKVIRKKILSADIIYVGGGNTLKMMILWRKLGIDNYLKQAHKNGTILSGLSAGAICWFKYGESDSRKFKNPDAPFSRVAGLGFVNALMCPHYNVEKERQADLKNMMRTTSGVAIALENCAAIEIVDDSYRIISSNKSANAYRVFWSRGKYHKEMIEKDKNCKPLTDLLTE